MPNDSISDTLKHFLKGCLHRMMSWWSRRIEACCSMRFELISQISVLMRLTAAGFNHGDQARNVPM